MQHNAITNELQNAIYAHNVKAGWWDAPVRPDGTTIALIHSELSESWRGLVHDIPDEHLPQYQNAVVELADAAIRIYDFFGHKKWDVEKTVAFVKRTNQQPFTPQFEFVDMATYYVDLHSRVSNALEGVRKNVVLPTDNEDETIDVAAFELAIALMSIYDCRIWDWPLEAALGDKRAYNANRADHKRENRAKDDGKKF